MSYTEADEYLAKLEDTHNYGGIDSITQILDEADNLLTKMVNTVKESGCDAKLRREVLNGLEHSFSEALYNEMEAYNRHKGHQYIWSATDDIYERTAIVGVTYRFEWRIV